MHLRKADVLFAHILLYDILMKYNEYLVWNDSYRIFTKRNLNDVIRYTFIHQILLIIYLHYESLYNS